MIFRIVLLIGACVIFAGCAGKDHCFTNADCPDGRYCQKAIGDCDGPGECSPMPEFCTMQYDPVCGCDGKTYGNACVAASEGVNIRHLGECRTDNDGRR